MTPFFAYLDPATGSLIVSAIVGALAAIGLFFKNYWYKVKSLLRLGTKQQSAPTPADEAYTE